MNQEAVFGAPQSRIIAPEGKRNPNEEAFQRLLVEISNGQWVADRLVPKFRDLLVVKAQGRMNDDVGDLPTTALTSIVYCGRTSIPDEFRLKCIGAIKGGSGTWKEYWVSAAEKLRPDSQVDFSNLNPVYLTRAMDLLSGRAPETRVTLDQVVQFYCCLKSTPFRSASHPHYFGTVFLTVDRPPVEIAQSLVHELAHQELFLLNLLDRLVNSSFDFNLTHAPYQGQLRPPIGRLHSAYALFRMIQFERQTQDEKLSRHQLQLKETIQSFCPGELTPLAQELVYEVLAKASN